MTQLDTSYKKVIKCGSCFWCRDYGNGWVYCAPRNKWLHTGYSHCKKYEKGTPPNVQSPNTWSWIKRVNDCSKQSKIYKAICVSPHESDKKCEHKQGEECILTGECNWKEIKEIEP